MAINRRNLREPGGIRWKILQSWIENGHEVAWMEYRGINVRDEPFFGEQLHCECYFDYQRKRMKCGDGKWRVGTVRSSDKDEYRCPAIKKVRESLIKKAAEANKERWQNLGWKNAILDIFKRVSSGENLWQHHEKIIYVQEVAKLLQIPDTDVWRYCDELFAEEKLDLNGAILMDYVSRFRFPKEVQQLFGYMIEEPLGWPNGEAGDGFLEIIEEAIHKRTDYKHGKRAFGEENYPNVATHILEMFALRWLRFVLARVKENPELLKGKYPEVDLDATLKSLEKLLEEFRKLKQATDP
ncbi:MAG: hypothetical protein HZB99_01310 [Candidatus Harrisonbacteria bacterium]|nr:hypothetical protein [Candidatus Harrisonbacteria bacterium]